LHQHKGCLQILPTGEAGVLNLKLLTSIFLGIGGDIVCGNIHDAIRLDNPPCRRSGMKRLVFGLMLLLSLVMAGAVPCQSGQDQSPIGGLRQAGKDIGKDLKKAGKETSQEIGKAGKEISKDMKKNAKKADKDMEKGFSRTMKEFRDNTAKSWKDFLKYMGWD
jgi:hypothetical protein